jgi:hypothetical protein
MESVKKSALDLIGEKVYSATTQKKHGGLYYVDFYAVLFYYINYS